MAGGVRVMEVEDIEDIVRPVMPRGGWSLENVALQRGIEICDEPSAT
jgi:hypothetical protein